MIKVNNRNIKTISVVNSNKVVSTDGMAKNLEPAGDIILGDEVTAIAENAFRNKPITSIYGKNVTSISGDSLNGTKITSITDENFPKLGISTSPNWYLVLRLPPTCTKIKLSGTRISLGSGWSALRYCSGLITAEFPHANLQSGASNNGVGTWGFSGCTNLILADCGFGKGIGNYAFSGDSKITTIILRQSSQIVSLSNTATFDETPFASGGNGGTIYIPEALYDHLGDGTNLDYKAATNWSTIDAYGTITWAKIEGSIWELDD